jgi:hypothetical protein
MKIPIFTENDDISGIVHIKRNSGKEFKHTGIKIVLVGSIELFYEKKLTSEFTSISRELEPLGSLTQDKDYKFHFKNFEKQYESYYGSQVRLSYFLRVSVGRQYASPIRKVQEVFVSLPLDKEPSDNVKPLKMEVGIEDCLHIEFEFPKNHYHLRDCIVGNVSFKLVKINIKYMEVNIIRRESTGIGKASKTISDDIVKYQIMDGCPFKREVIPIRLFMSGFEFTPTM